MKWDFGIGARARDVWRSRDEPEGLRFIADVYWNTLIVVGGCVIAGMIFYGGSKFISIRGASQEDTLLSSEGGGILFNRVELESTLEGLEAREARYESLVKTAPSIADPSR